MSKRAKRERETALGRRDERRVYLIVCEGETEKRYFDSMRRYSGVQVHAVHVRQAKHPQRERVIRTARETDRSTLHFSDHRAALVSGAKASKTLQDLFSRWSKGSTQFEDFARGLQDALERAERLPAGSDPSTGVYR